MLDKTMIFSLGEERDDAIKRSLTEVSFPAELLAALYSFWL